ncbi:hypothetical protein ACUUL3_04790 [Thiovibrio sp. JS02]
MELQKNDLYLKGTVHKVFTKKTQKGKMMYTYKILTDGDLKYVKSMKNGLAVGDQFFSTISVKPYISNKTGMAGLEIWEGDRIELD